jgi:outer membrane protein
MKTPLKSLIALAFADVFAVAAQAQPAVKIAVVDMAKLYDAHYKTVEQNEKLKVDQQKAEDELQKLNAEGNALVEQFKKLEEQLNNPALSVDAKTKTQQEMQAKEQDIRRKQAEVNQFRGQTQRQLQQRINSFKQLLLDEISKTAVEIAKKKGATLVLDKSGPTLIGLPSLLYFDPAYDVTEDVSKEINRDRPAGSAAPAAAKPADAPAVSFPGSKK